MYTECDLDVWLEVCHAEPAALLLHHLLLHQSASQPLFVLCFPLLSLSASLSLSVLACIQMY